MEVGSVRRVDIEQKMRSAYLSYAMSVITARALPDVRDGLKPVQRRILYAMHDMGLHHDRPTRKSARIVGEVLGKYHPHGDSAVYDAMVRMAQDFSMRYMLIDGQGNFGSIDGDSAAAMRYTEARLTAIGEELLLDLDKDTVDLIDNFDGSLKEPSVLPAKLPNLLLNGVGGIAVGMATNIPPHNLGEIADAIAFLIDRYETAEDVSLDELMRFVQGPDFPTGGTILGGEGVRQAYATGKGRVIMRAQVHIEEQRGGHSAIIVTELPYQVNKSTLVERIADLVRNDRLQGVGDLRDESDRTGMRVVVELKRGVDAQPVLRDLIKLTQLQSTFGVNMLALVDGVPRVLSLKRILLHYIDHRQQVLVRRTQYELERALARAHVLEGLLIALDNLDAVIDTIRRSRTAETAQQNLMLKFKLSEIQARAILDMQLRRLAALERRKIEDEYKEVKARIEYLRGLLASKQAILRLIKEDVLDLKARYGDARRTRISAEAESGELCLDEMLPDSDLVILLTRRGQVLRLPLDACQARQGGLEGLLSSVLDGEDALAAATVANARETVFFFTDQGNVFRAPAHQLPDGIQQPRGAALRSIAHLAAQERAVAVLHSDNLDQQDVYVCLGTSQGKVKRLALSEMNGLGGTSGQVISLSDGDTLGWATFCGDKDELLLVTALGRAIRFAADTVRPQGRSAGGMRGISLGDGDAVIGMEQASEKAECVLVTRDGFAKRSPLQEFNTQGRGGIGVLAMDVSKLGQTGPAVYACVAQRGDSLVLSSVAGQTFIVPLEEVPALERASWGRVVSKSRRNAIVHLSGDDRVVDVVAVGQLMLAGSGASAVPPKPVAQRANASPTGGSSAARAKPTSQEGKAAVQERKLGASRRPRSAPSASEAPPAAQAPKTSPTSAVRKPARAKTASEAQPAARAAKASSPKASAAPPEIKPTRAKATPKPTQTAVDQTSAAAPKAEETQPQPAKSRQRPAPASEKPKATPAAKQRSAREPQQEPAEEVSQPTLPLAKPTSQRRTRRSTVSKPPSRSR
jgi:DNA gyrase subunit A